MSDQYTPELEEIRADWVDMRAELEPNGSTTRYTEVAPTYRDAFDRAIAKIKAAAWEEGREDERASVYVNTSNPYTVTL